MTVRQVIASLPSSFFFQYAMCLILFMLTLKTRFENIVLGFGYKRKNKVTLITNNIIYYFTQISIILCKTFSLNSNKNIYTKFEIVLRNVELLSTMYQAFHTFLI